MSYTPKPGSKPALAIEYLQAFPEGAQGSDLAEAMGVPVERLVSSLGAAMTSGLIVKLRSGGGNQRAIYALGHPVDENFKCALWEDGSIYMEGVQADDGSVSLTLAQSRVLAKLILGQIHV